MTPIPGWPSGTRLDFTLRRDRNLNTCTVMSTRAALGFGVDVPFEALFLAHYRAIRELARIARPGVGVVAVELESYRLVTKAWVARRPDRPNALLIGRHSQCDLILPDERVSLRHAACIVPRLERWPLSYTLHELRTSEGVFGGLGHPVPGARVERAGLFRIGPYALFTFATGAPDEWPELASDAWARRDGSMLAIGHEPVQRPAPTERSSRTSITAIRGPLKTSERLVFAGEPRQGVLRVLSERGTRRLALGPSALERGVLLGRYPRCDYGLTHENLSRVHLLVIEVGADVVAVDTASTCGTYVDGRAERVVMLSRGEAARLADDDAEVQLEP